jgi:hypothetical protein
MSNIIEIAEPGLRPDKTKSLKVTIAAGFHLFPFRTEKLSPSAPMVLLIVGE